MDRTAVNSGAIKSIGHDPGTNTLEIEFKGGAVHQYGGVDAQAHAALVGADSIGSHFHAHIKNQYESKAV